MHLPSLLHSFTQRFPSGSIQPCLLQQLHTDDTSCVLPGLDKHLGTNHHKWYIAALSNKVYSLIVYYMLCITGPSALASPWQRRPTCMWAPCSPCCPTYTTGMPSYMQPVLRWASCPLQWPITSHGATGFKVVVTSSCMPTPCCQSAVAKQLGLDSDATWSVQLLIAKSLLSSW